MPLHALTRLAHFASRKARHPLFRALQIIIALALLGFVISQVHWRDYPVTDEAGLTVSCPGILSSMSGADPRWLAAAFAVSIASLGVAALRWRLLLAVQGVHISIGEMVKLQFMGEFFNTVIPGMVGGDVVKAYCVMRKTTHKAHVLVSVFVDRLLGVCAMVFTAAVMLALLLAMGVRDRDLLHVSAPSVAVVFTAACAVLALLLSPRLRRLCGLQKLYARLPIAKHLAAAGDAADGYRAAPGTLVRAFLISLLAQFLGSAFVFLLGVALGLDVPWPHYFLHVPLILIISALPITPGGIGVMEELYLLYFVAAGNPSLVLTLAVLVRAMTLLSALPGGLVAALTGNLSARERLSL
ncbi:MAG: flippase-like domain-containing protein [Verrucomicrobia bacterium]|jgi:glycosyltransferase 2 family protein|nr:flippase-like domain-containing protein [Verrucomicrobiota bacterium]MBT7069181.1 flippase-like domain-containing protein [Verrucomicrobiota bacterium]MBT7699615.1 flippase-like domain-containing protein [Verrucomicrobiota bacterium]